ncbi:prephenate dehydratase [Candidatus Desantisbacteria bacterium]|nr:prephenate dehydratase [Candidatus Desantisbacteria bacterium]
MDENMELDELREKVDELDDKIIELLNKRLDLALCIGKVKHEKSLDFYVPSREQAILERIEKQNKGAFPDSSLKSIYREIMAAARFCQHPLKIAYFGPKATFTHMASIKQFGSSAAYIPVKSIKDVFMEVEHDRVDYGVVPIENSTEGVVNYTFDMFIDSNFKTYTDDMFIDSNLKIYAEIFLEISHYLLSNSKISEIKKVYSHPQPLAQCRNWLETHLPNIKLIEVLSTAEAAIMASREKGTAAIASSLAAEIYSLKILAERIEDNADNFTRFLVIGKRINQKSKYDKTSIMFSVKDKVGALYNSLKPFEKYKINLTKIESRPSRKKVWEYIFFVDFNGHINSKKIQKALKELKKECVFLKVLGSYPEDISYSRKK